MFRIFQLAKLHRTPIVRSEGLFDTSDQGEGHSMRSVKGQGQQSDATTKDHVQTRYENDTPNGSTCSSVKSITARSAQGDISGRSYKYHHDDLAGDHVMSGACMDKRNNESKSEGHVVDARTQENVGRRKKVPGMITEGLKVNTAANQPRSKGNFNVIICSIH